MEIEQPSRQNIEARQRFGCKASAAFSRRSTGEFNTVVPDLPAGRYYALVYFAAANYPLAQHCCFMRHSDPAKPYTFSEMHFAVAPPGVRVGPWPAWRGLPSMPEISLTVHDRHYSGTFQFWGDETQTGTLRGVFCLPVAPGEELTVRAGDHRLQPEQIHFYPAAQRQAEPIPVVLQPHLRDRHPRLLFGTETVHRLRGEIHDSKKAHWLRLVSLLDNWDLLPGKTPESKVLPGPERLFGEDRVVISALHALLNPALENQSRAVAALLDYVAETAKADFAPLQIDTQSGEVLFTMAVGYDWLFATLTSAQREIVKNRLWAIADICWQHLGYHRRDYAQAHFLGCGMGLLAFAFLFWEQHPRAQEWAAYLRDAFAIVIQMLPADGFFPHGINLWIYEHGFLLRWLELFRHCAGVDLWQVTPYWQNASVFRAAATSADGRFGVTFGDPQYRVGGDSWCHDLIAARTGTTVTRYEGIGDFLRDKPTDGIDFRHVPPRRRVWELLYSDANLPQQKPLPAVQFFRDGGQVFVRGDDGSVFSFRSGPPLGWQRYLAGEQGGYGHSDPVNGSFLLHLDGLFAIAGSGPTYRRDTSLHNLISIDGQGQVGDSTVWLPDFIPPEMLAETPDLTIHGSVVNLTAETAASYLPHLGVRSCRRSLLLLPGKFLLGADTVLLQRARTVQLNFHSWGTFVENNPAMGKAFAIKHGETQLVIAVLAPAAVHARTGMTAFVPAYPHDGRRDSFLQIESRGKQITFVWYLGFGAEPAPRLEWRGESMFQVHFAGASRFLFDGSRFVADAPSSPSS